MLELPMQTGVGNGSCLALPLRPLQVRRSLLMERVVQEVEEFINQEVEEFIKLRETGVRASDTWRSQV